MVFLTMVVQVGTNGEDHHSPPGFGALLTAAILDFCMCEEGQLTDEEERELEGGGMVKRE